MRRAEKILRYFFIMGGTVLFLCIADFVILGIISAATDGEKAYVHVGKAAAYLKGNSHDGFFMEEEGVRYIDNMEAFAMLIGESGEVIWEYKMPEELPRTYSMKDVASFTRWYLQDYPVYTWIMDEGILVLGKEKNTVWRLSVLYSQDTVNAYIQYIFMGIPVNILLLAVIPFLVLRRQSRRREQERTAWIAGVSHDIRTPLTLVLGNAVSLQEESEEALVRKKAFLIEEQALRIRTLVTNLNTENKLQFGIMRWNREEFFLAAVIRDTLCGILNSDPGEQYEFDLIIEEGAEGVRHKGDKELVIRLLENLISNSIRHNPQGCHVGVTLEKGQRWPYRYLLTVEDNGRGVSEKQLKYINRSLHMDKLPEHGMGLRLVKEIAHHYHWHIRFDQGENGGFLCRIWIL